MVVGTTFPSHPTATLDELTGTLWENKRMIQMDVLYDLVDGRRTIQEIIDLSFMGEFDACKNLLVIMDAGMIEPVIAEATTDKKKKKKGTWSSSGCHRVPLGRPSSIFLTEVLHF
jgi:hypothetical protein